MCKPDDSKPSLFERLGGTAAVRAAVEEFYQRVLDDEQLSPFFEDSTIPHLKMHQLEFFKLAFGCPSKNNDAPVDVAEFLREKHRRLFVEQGLNETHFDLVAGHFVATLQHLSINEELIDEAVGVIGPLRTVFEVGVSESAHEEKKDDGPSLLHAATDDSKPQTLMQKLGGNASVKAAVEGLYSRLLADEDLSPFFEDVSMTALKIHQIEFMKVAFSQIPDDFDVAEFMKTKHARLFTDKGLNESHFDKLAGHFVATLEDLSVPQNLIDEAVAVVGPLRPVFEQGAKDAQEQKL